MLRTYATGRIWPFRSVSDLLGAARRAEAVVKSLGWAPKDADQLSQVVKELGGDLLQQAGGGTCRLEASATVAEIMVEDLGGGYARTRIVTPPLAVPIAAVG